MDLSKSYEFFQPEMITDRIHIIGCGSVGSTVAELLMRFGLTKFALYDFDEVEPKNIVNQMFFADDIGRPKVEAVADMMRRINKDVDIKLVPDGWHGQRLSGYIFLCVDSMKIRNEIVARNIGNPNIKAMFDFRTRLTDAQHYAADWAKPKSVINFQKTMAFTDEEAAAATPMSACKVTLCVAPTVRLICNYGVVNFVNFVKTGQMKKVVFCDAFSMSIEAFDL